MSRKYKILIVDDEFRIGLLIKNLIEWDELQAECIEVVTNGEEALSVIDKKEIDIVITDIRMPKINGLDLIRITKEKKPKINFVVISGYKEFEYAHRALQYGVAHYLLKPIDENELNRVLQKVTEEIWSSSYQESEMEQMKQTVQASENIIREKVFQNIISEESTTLDEINEVYNISLEQGIYRGVNIKLDYIDYEKCDMQHDVNTLDKMVEIIEKEIEEVTFEYLISKRNNLYIQCLLCYDKENDKKVMNWLSGCLSEIQAHLLKLDQYEVTVGIGDKIEDWGNVKQTISQANTAVKNRIKYGTGRLIYINQLNFENEGTYVVEEIDKNKDLINAIETYNKMMFEQAINDIYSKAQFSESIDYSLWYKMASEIIDIFFKHIEVESKEGEELKILMNNISEHCYTIQKLKKVLKQYLGEYLEVCMRIVENELTKPIREAKKYVELHFAEKIILEDVASVVGLNPVYFSVLFKKETGENFSVYLTEYRMKVAKERIKMGNETIAAIASEVGYKDSKHFSQTFTKVVGVKPALYRRLHS